MTLFLALALLAQTLQPGSTLVYGIRVYRPVGASQVEWKQLIPPATQPIPLTDAARTACGFGERTPVPNEVVNRAMEIMDGNGENLAWPDDHSLFAYLARDATLLKVGRATDGQVMSTIHLPERGEHWNYPTG